MELCFLSRQSEKEQVVPADGAGPDTAICLSQKCKKMHKQAETVVFRAVLWKYTKV